MPAVRTTCPYCGVGCGVKALAGPDRSVTIEGDEAHPANRGRLCSKGTHLGETVSLEGRLLHPAIGGARTSWNAALDAVAALPLVAKLIFCFRYQVSPLRLDLVEWIFDIAVFALLVHVQSRSYVRLWFK